MSFLSPWFLAGFAALGVPLFVHLLRKHVTIPRPVSSLMFFERGTQSSTKHRRLRYLLLFALRTLMILLIVVAFANPFLRRPLDTSRSLLLIVLDNSFSMRAGSHFADAKRQALDLLNARPKSQRAQIVALGGQLQLLTQPTQDSGQLKNALDNIQIGDGHANFADLARSTRSQSESAPGPIELHLFSDIQRTAMPDNFANAVLPSTVNLVLHPVVKISASPNWTIESIDAPADLIDPKDPATSRVKAVIAGYETPDAEKTISLIVNGKVVANRTVKISANGHTPVEFSPLPIDYGFNRCEIRIEGDDSLPADNTARFVVRHADPQRVLLVHPPTDQRSSIYFGTALNAAAHGTFILQPITADQTTDIDPTKFAFTVLADATNLPGIFEHTLEQYVSKGGNVLVALGVDAQRHPHIPLWSGSIQRTENFASSGPATVGQVDFTFPVLEQEKPGRDNGGWGGTKIWYASLVDSNGARIVARLNDQTPLLLDKQVGEGHVLLFTSGLDGITNDLPLQPVFVSFVDKAARYLSGNERLSGLRTVDSFVQLRSSPVASNQITNSVEVVDPDGLRPLSLSEAKTIQTFRLSRAGFYQIRFANGQDALLGVNPDRRESDLTPIPPEMQSLWAGSHQEQGKDQKTMAPEMKYQPSGLWWYFMLLTLLVAIIEALLSGRYLKVQREDI